MSGKETVDKNQAQEGDKVEHFHDEWIVINVRDISSDPSTPGNYREELLIRSIEDPTKTDVIRRK